MTGKALDLRHPIVYFRGGPRINRCPRWVPPRDWTKAIGWAWTVYRVPKDTRDPRWRTCTRHHVACDCREAEQAETIAELTGELTWVWRQLDELIDGHATYDADGDTAGRICQCTACQLARKMWHYPNGWFDR